MLLPPDVLRKTLIIITLFISRRGIRQKAVNIITQFAPIRQSKEKNFAVSQGVFPGRRERKPL
jgi:hypothetical protein